jgi:exodeoxyribonuclease V alpha subunit
MDRFDHWPTLNKHFTAGHFSFVDLCFAKSILKKIGSNREEHACLLAVLLRLSRQGHLMLDLSPQNLHAALKLLGLEQPEILAEHLLRGAQSFPPSPWIYREKNALYLQKNWDCETKILEALHRLSMSQPRIPLPAFTFSPQLNAAQKTAIELVRHHSLALLTGGPGTGKTFTAAELVKSCLASLPEKERQAFRIMVAAPTGKAVARLEMSLRKAVGEETLIRTGTVHALLGLKLNFSENEEIQPLFADLIIIDECSMIDAKIFSQLLQAIPLDARTLLIGDKDQLPPVEAGSIFADLLEASVLPATHLTESLRSNRNEILEFARYICTGDDKAALQMLIPNATENFASDQNQIFSGVRRKSSLRDIEWVELNQELPHLLAQLWKSYQIHYPSCAFAPPASQDLLSSLTRFGLLSCMRQGMLGVEAINQYFLHQSLKRAEVGGWWPVPVMITRNDAELDLYNGDLGFIVRKVTSEFSLRTFSIEDYALFQDRKGSVRQMSALALSSFEYCYCLSVHKSQGSEYDEVVILMPEGSVVFGREVLYTALTRARQKATLITRQDILQKTIEQSSRKISGLAPRLKHRI